MKTNDAKGDSEPFAWIRKARRKIDSKTADMSPEEAADWLNSEARSILEKWGPADPEKYAQTMNALLKESDLGKKPVGTGKLKSKPRGLKLKRLLPQSRKGRKTAMISTRCRSMAKAPK